MILFNRFGEAEEWCPFISFLGRSEKASILQESHKYLTEEYLFSK